MSALKQLAAEAALEYITENSIIGVGTGSTVNFFIDALKKIKVRIEACVASSIETEHRLKALGFPVVDLNTVSELPLYIDGADEINPEHQMIKGGGGALTREKIIATVATHFICIADERKWVKKLGGFPIAIEVLPMARSYVARELVKLGGDPAYRQGFKTDNGNIILDVYNLSLKEPISSLEDAINCIPGVVENGLFAKRLADTALIATQEGLKID